MKKKLFLMIFFVSITIRLVVAQTIGSDCSPLGTKTCIGNDIVVCDVDGFWREGRFSCNDYSQKCYEFLAVDYPELNTDCEGGSCKQVYCGVKNPECMDMEDNNEDGKKDYPQDENCLLPVDNNEGRCGDNYCSDIETDENNYCLSDCSPEVDGVNRNKPVLIMWIVGTLGIGGIILIARYAGLLPALLSGIILLYIFGVIL